MSRILRLAALALALGASPVLAQGQGQGAPGGPPGGGANRRMTALMNGITLTAPQQTQVDSITTAFRAQMPAMTPGTPPDSATMARRRELTQQMDAAVRAVLTTEQQAVWDRNLAALPPMGQRRQP